MAFVDDDEVKEVRWIIAEPWRWIAVLWRTTHERLEDREEQAAVFRHLALLADRIRLDPHHGIFGECGEGVERLIGQNVAIMPQSSSGAGYCGTSASWPVFMSMA